MPNPTSSPDSELSHLVEAARSALADTLGTSFDLWALGDGQVRSLGALGPPDPDSPPRNDASFRCGGVSGPRVSAEALQRAAKQPIVVKQADERFLLGLPLGKNRHETLVATATLDDGPEESLLKMAKLLLSDLDLRRELQRCHDDLDACAVQIGIDFEQLTFLRKLAEYLDLSDASQGPWDLARIALPQLAAMVRAEALVLLTARHSQEPEGQRLVADRAEVWIGPEILPVAACCRLVERFHEAARRKPFIQNNFAAHPEAGEFPGVREFVLVCLRKGERILGWLVAVNQMGSEDIGVSAMRRVEPGEDAPAPPCGFGTVEAGLISSVATILATHACNVQLLREKESLLVKTVRAMVSAIDAKDPYTFGHSERVALVARFLGRRLGLSEELCEQLYLAGLLHDLGKLGVPDAVLRKPGPLTDEEFDAIRPHPERGWMILHDLEELGFLIPGILHHHERYDGRGYPDGLAGEEIPLSARILAVADSYDAMASDRPYRRGMPLEKVTQILRDGSGKQWDPRVVEVFLGAIPEIRALWESYRPETPVRVRIRRRPGLGTTEKPEAGSQALALVETNSPTG